MYIHVSVIKLFACVVPDEQLPRAKDLVCGRTMNKCGELYWGLIVLHAATYMILWNLFCRAAPFIVLSSSFAQRSLYEARIQKGVVWRRHWHALEEA